VAALVPALGKVTDCGKTKSAADLRSVVISFVTRFSFERLEYEPESLQAMSDFIHAMAEVDLTDVDMMLSRRDRPHYELPAPVITAYRNQHGELVFDDAILEYPIGFSVAVYPDLKRPPSTTPILWTRDLDRYVTFDRPYDGYVAFLDGHVEYLEGKPDVPNVRLETLLGPQGGASHALRILRHVPEDFDALELEPLPVRFHQELSKPDWRRVRMGLVVLSPGLLAGLLVFWVNKKRGWARVGVGGLAFVIVEFALFFLIPLQFL
jgi:prepilin-type processing-associated H-X9-DG protein